ncbi:unnamed protein product [Lasius platythorax]|uniref:Uncharacterized protein n=1 Tax=Lasius platythorax TaxID=488582 RepID=A0AAV2P9C5_9HYME
MGETSGVAGDRCDRVSWELAKRFAQPWTVPTELVCNSVLSATRAGMRGGGCGGVLLRRVGEKVHLPSVQMGNYRI